MEENGIHHITSAPYHPAINGLAERFVQTMKHALEAGRGRRSLNQRLSAFLLSYRNTPHATTKVSPASALVNRQLRTRLDLLKPLKTKEVVHLQQRAQVDRRAKAPATVLSRTGRLVPAMTQNHQYLRFLILRFIQISILKNLPCHLQMGTLPH